MEKKFDTLFVIVLAVSWVYFNYHAAMKYLTQPELPKVESLSIAILVLIIASVLIGFFYGLVICNTWRKK